MRKPRSLLTILALISAFVLCSLPCRAQAALLLEEPYGFFGELNPTGHVAIYFEHICAETPVTLRRCSDDEPGSVIARYQGMSGYDWVAVPLIPYLYAVENEAQVPDRVNRETVTQMRSRYREAHLLSLGEKLPEGSIFQGGWSQLAGVAYDRRIYAFRFATTREQDDLVMRRLNARKNRSHFNLLYNNCADFARDVLNSYFPRSFRRNVFPDAGMTTPKQIAYKLERYARKHPETEFTVLGITQVPGNRHQSHSNKSVAESLSTTVYAIPIVLANPYIAAGLFVDYLVRGRYRLVPKDAEILDAETLSALTGTTGAKQNPHSTTFQAKDVIAGGAAETPPAVYEARKN